jgi:hypothetical protein
MLGASHLYRDSNSGLAVDTKQQTRPPARLRFGTEDVHKILLTDSESPKIRHGENRTAFYALTYLYPYLAHLLSDLGEIWSAQNSVAPVKIGAG